MCSLRIRGYSGTKDMPNNFQLCQEKCLVGLKNMAGEISCLETSCQASIRARIFFKPVYIVIFVVAAMKYPGQQLKEGSNYFGLKFQDIVHYGREVLTKASDYIVSPIKFQDIVHFGREVMTSGG